MRIYPLIESISLVLVGLFSLNAFENVDAYFAERKRGLETDFQLSNVPLVSTPLTPDCDKPVCTGKLAPIYCTGDILSLSWQYGLQHACPGDKLKFPAEKVLENFEKLKKPVDRENFINFCSKNFQKTAYLEQVELPDWRHDPEFILEIKNQKYQNLAKQIYVIWRKLARKFTEDVHKNGHLYPVLPVNNTFIVPGGRFKIYFYWDSYWIIKGLLISGLFHTAKGMIENFAQIVRTKGFIPNSGNIQLSERSQPPLFIHIVYEYYNSTKDLESVKNNRDTVRTQKIIPVDLNVFLAQNMRYMVGFYNMLQDREKSFEYQKKFNDLLRNINEVLWNENKAGIPTTLPVPSKEQWDYPNVWAPVLHLFVKSLLATDSEEMHTLAKKEADKFINTVYNGLNNPQNDLPSGIWEKYDAESASGRPGHGGEYFVQEGFGWTNGAVLDLIQIFRNEESLKIAEDIMKETINKNSMGVKKITSPKGTNGNSLLDWHLLIVIVAVIFCIVLMFVYVMHGTYESYRGLMMHRRLPTEEPQCDEETGLLESVMSDDDEDTADSEIDNAVRV
ncbi:hypothetical protein WR25_09815 isoform B [Diploscapter pachys]|uniref:Trehalase n=1 Tax=Diploscapter pachys TaxID=2018661 RepID=A0A2A2LGW4_9BILA|nr:hypothetical protein WR25_09815 isoform A [Diploscapter pachys]PAV85376.1 hypothetical protein WR25_09815 isoform B [Diploscapter pachys]